MMMFMERDMAEYFRGQSSVEEAMQRHGLLRQPIAIFDEPLDYVKNELSRMLRDMKTYVDDMRLKECAPLVIRDDVGRIQMDLLAGLLFKATLMGTPLFHYDDKAIKRLQTTRVADIAEAFRYGEFERWGSEFEPFMYTLLKYRTVSDPRLRYDACIDGVEMMELACILLDEVLRRLNGEYAEQMHSALCDVSKLLYMYSGARIDIAMAKRRAERAADRTQQCIKTIKKTTKMRGRIDTSSTNMLKAGLPFKRMSPCVYSCPWPVAQQSSSMCPK